MSTQIGFDLSGLTEAIERVDLDYQLALYAADAEVRVIEPCRSDRLYQGKQAICDWLQELNSRRQVHRVVNLTNERDRVTLIDQSRCADGRNLVYQMTAEVRRGQISHQTVTLTWEDVLASS